MQMKFKYNKIIITSGLICSYILFIRDKKLVKYKTYSSANTGFIVNGKPMILSVSLANWLRDNGIALQ